jgi:hypothetical protein
MKKYPTQEEVQYYFTYENGKLYWKNTTKHSIKVGDLAGTIVKNKFGNYYRIGLNGSCYLMHRLIYIYFNGEIPSGMYIDHINGNSLNNNIENLRICNKYQNQYNSKKSSVNTSGIKGITFENKKWRCRCRVNGKKYHVGFYDDINEAKLAVENFRKLHHGEFSRHS